MTLRDYFAAQAIIPLVSGAGTVRINGETLVGDSDFAKAAYILADAMLEARSK